jgi:hypothetical protein
MHELQVPAPFASLAEAVDQLPDARAVNQLDVLHVEHEAREIPTQKIIDLLAQASDARADRQLTRKLDYGDRRTICSALDLHCWSSRNAHRGGRCEAPFIRYWVKQPKHFKAGGAARKIDSPARKRRESTHATLSPGGGGRTRETPRPKAMLLAV